MFIVIAKRRDDFKISKDEAMALRPVNKDYSKTFLDFSLIVFATLMAVCYIMYSHFSPYFGNSSYLSVLSSALVLIGLLRYLQEIFVHDRGGSPTQFAFKDRFIQAVLVLWVTIFIFLIYLN
jgi:hypothetical protein